MNLIALIFAAALAVAGCPNVDSCSVVDVGDRIEVTISDSADTGSAEDYLSYEPLPSCGNFDVPDTRAVLKMVEGTEAGGCEVPGCPPDYPSPSEGFRQTGVPGSGGGYVCAHTARVRTGTCAAVRNVALRKKDGADPFGAGPVVLIRTLSYSPQIAGLTCSDPLSIFSKDAAQDDGDYECSDAWTVNLKRK